MSACRLCKRDDPAACYQPLFKYSVRHYAHAECALDRWGEKFLHMIPAHQVGNLPWRALKRAGLIPQAEAIIKAEKEAA